MMRLIKNNEPVFHKHICTDYKRNSEISDKELHDFTVEVLMQEYESCGVTVHKINKINGNEADFNFRSHDRSVNVKVIYKGRGGINLDKIDTSWLVEEYNAHGTFPRLIFADAWCISDVSNDGKPEVCGGDYCFRYETLSVIPNQRNIEHKELSKYQIATQFLNAWKNLDTSVVEPFIDISFHYSSNWVFDEMPCKIEYIDYLRGKFNAMKSSQNTLDISIGHNKEGEYALLFDQKGDLLQLELTIENGYIIRAFMTENDGSYSQTGDKEKLYMVHGDHNECIIPLYGFVKKLKEILHSSKFHLNSYTNISLEEDTVEDTDVFSLKYGEGDLMLLSLIAFSKSQQNNIYVSTFPLMKGYTTKIKIDKVVEWDNMVEATVYASVDDFSFAFFAADYYVNKGYYKPGKTISVDLSALGIKVEKAQTFFSFEGQDAINWYKKNGEKPCYDEDGNVKPVEFNTDNLVAYLPLDPKAPDEAQFQSPARMLSSSIIFCERDFDCAQVIIHRFDNDEELNVPLFFHNDTEYNINRGVPLKGCLWLTGFVTGKHNIKSFNVCPKIAANFAYLFDYSFMYLDKNLMYLLDFLPDLKLKRGYILDYFTEGDKHGTIVRAYCHQYKSTQKYIPYDKEGNIIPYDDSLKIADILNYKVADTVPQTLPYFTVPFTESGIMQAWILNNIEEFLPRSWHDNYNYKDFIFNKYVLDKLFPENMKDDEFTVGRSLCRDKVMAIDINDILPIIEIQGDKALLKYSYWNDWEGLVKITMDVSKDKDSVSFRILKTDILVKYDCGIIF